MAGLGLFIIAEIVALSPATLEESPVTAMLDPDTLLEHAPKTLAGGIPSERIPEYTVDRFQYASTHGGQKQWKLLARKAFLFHREKIVHARDIIAYLYNPDGNATTVTGLEAKYFLDKRDLEIFGTVKTKFPDGFETESEYLQYLPNSRLVHIPLNYGVKGQGKQSGANDISFESQGLNFSMDSSEIVLPSAARVTMVQKKEPTLITSDRCLILRAKQMAYFTMDQTKKTDQRFVLITQPKLKVRSRRVDLNYGDSVKLLHYLTAYEDVLIEDKEIKYATGGRADFNTNENVIVLRQYPQVYQNNDTVTGDVIILHRDTDVVEVENSNAFSEGK